MKLSDHILIWNHAAVTVLDVRHVILEPGDSLRAYRLPASAFVYTVRGRAQVSLDGTKHATERFHVLHGGKGVQLDITAEEWLEYYLILYKAVLTLPARQELVRLMEAGSPFQSQYGFSPLYPVALYELAGRMSGEWERPDALQKLHVKTLFYQFVHEVLGHLHRQGTAVLRPDPVAQAVRYIHDHFRTPVTLEALADILDCNSRQLLRMFKSRMKTSPIDYLIRVRMDKAKELLLGTDLTLKEIAEHVGYPDSYYFSRMFKKYEGVSPRSFAAHVPAWPRSRNNPSLMSGSPIVSIKPSGYSDFDNHYQDNREGDLSMMYKDSRTSMAGALILCLLLLLSACSTAAPTSTTGAKTPSGGTSTTAPAATSATEAKAVQTPRVIKHAMGEVTLTGTPERVVILTNEGTEALLTVGIKPIGAVKSWLGDPWYDHIKDSMQGVTVVGDELQPNLELIASLKPDLIIGNKVRQEKIYEQLKQIAPTVFAADLVGDWKINFKLYAEALNKMTEGEKAMADFDKRVAEAKAKLGDKVKTQVSVARFSATQVRIYQKQTFSGVLLDQLGIARPASQDKDSFMEVLSKEKIPSLDGDVLFYFVTEAAGKTDAAKVVEEWKNDPLFKNLNVAKTNKVIQVDEGIWNSAGGYKAANLLLNEIMAYFNVK
ncbi:ABC transporter substrate-binding protein [Paenibacillus filicis]|uniref:ABC transporter substrate-binding protein n=1 Tax=Paenibacillus filicis TaxID=669464 RepID=A0ABU9DPK6_9BACL